VLMEKITAFLTPQFNKNRVRVEKDFSTEVSDISGDPELLQQVFLNVILNGVQAMPEGGELRIKTVAGHAPAHILHRVGVADEMDDAADDEAQVDVVSVSISDTGKGITPDNMAKIFSPFFTTRQQGTGLGLSITRKIVEQHGGGITVESTPGSGATFSIYLPAVGKGFPGGGA